MFDMESGNFGYLSGAVCAPEPRRCLKLLGNLLALKARKTAIDSYHRPR